MPPSVTVGIAVAMSGTICAPAPPAAFLNVSRPLLVASRISQPSLVYESAGSRWSGLSGMPARSVPPLTGVPPSRRPSCVLELLPQPAAAQTAGQDCDRHHCCSHRSPPLGPTSPRADAPLLTAGMASRRRLERAIDVVVGVGARSVRNSPSWGGWIRIPLARRFSVQRGNGLAWRRSRVPRGSRVAAPAENQSWNMRADAAPAGLEAGVVGGGDQAVGQP